MSMTLIPPLYDFTLCPYATRDGSEEVLLRVRSRARWQLEIEELIALCDETERRRCLRRDPNATTYASPISHAFVEDRLQLDEPLVGHVARRKDTGYMVGFVLCTTFTTWVEGENFRWCVSSKEVNSQKMVGPAMVAKLNACERHGDPLDSGCVWARVAELSLVGGLGCGALLVGQLLERMRDGEINAPDGKKYQYVVLQSTKCAEQFYLRMGFRQIGTEARHYTHIVNNVVQREKVGPWLPFRHFEYTVGDVEPSTMMALSLSGWKWQRRIPPNWVSEVDVLPQHIPEDMLPPTGQSAKKTRPPTTSATKAGHRPPPITPHGHWFDRYTSIVCQENARLVGKGGQLPLSPPSSDVPLTPISQSLALVTKGSRRDILAQSPQRRRNGRRSMNSTLSPSSPPVSNASYKEPRPPVHCLPKFCRLPEYVPDDFDPLAYTATSKKTKKKGTGRGPGRPRKDGTPTGSPRVKVKSGGASSAKGEKRGPGRPRKDGVPHPPFVKGVKRGPGRPRKDGVPHPPLVKRGPGRPKGSKTKRAGDEEEVLVIVSKKKRKTKHEPTEVAWDPKPRALNKDGTVVKRGPGRPRKFEVMSSVMSTGTPLPTPTPSLSPIPNSAPTSTAPISTSASIPFSTTALTPTSTSAHTPISSTIPMSTSTSPRPNPNQLPATLRIATTSPMATSVATSTRAILTSKKNGTGPKRGPGRPKKSELTPVQSSADNPAKMAKVPKSSEKGTEKGSEEEGAPKPPSATAIKRPKKRLVANLPKPKALDLSPLPKPKQPKSPADLSSWSKKRSRVPDEPGSVMVRKIKNLPMVATKGASTGKTLSKAETNERTTRRSRI